MGQKMGNYIPPLPVLCAGTWNARSPKQVSSDPKHKHSPSTDQWPHSEAWREAPPSHPQSQPNRSQDLGQIGWLTHMRELLPIRDMPANRRRTLRQSLREPMGLQGSSRATSRQSEYPL